MIISLENEHKSMHGRKKKNITKMDLAFQGGRLNYFYSFDIYFYEILVTDFNTILDLCRTGDIMISLLHMKNSGLSNFVYLFKVLLYLRGRNKSEPRNFHLVSVDLKLWFLDQQYQHHLTC